MRVVVVYPVPFDAWQTFGPFVKRFVDTFKQYPPGCDYELLCVNTWGEPVDEVRSWFYGIKTRWLNYDEDGCDIGAFIYASALAPGFLVCMTTRCYFHREGWLKCFVDARDVYGSGIYGASGSWETQTPHIRTSAFGIDAALLCAFPRAVNNRADGQKVEWGEWCLTTHILNQNLPAVEVTWSGSEKYPNWRKSEKTNIYRRGDQDDVLVWDKHTDLYRDASESEKDKMSRAADPPGAWLV